MLIKQFILNKEQVDLIIHLCNSELNALESVTCDPHYPRSIMSLIEQKKLEIKTLVSDISSQYGNKDL